MSSDNPAQVEVAVTMVRSLMQSGALNDDDKQLVLAAGAVVLQPAVEEYHDRQDDLDEPWSDS